MNQLNPNAALLLYSTNTCHQQWKCLFRYHLGPSHSHVTWRDRRRASVKCVPPNAPVLAYTFYYISHHNCFPGYALLSIYCLFPFPWEYSTLLSLFLPVFGILWTVWARCRILCPSADQRWTVLTDHFRETETYM